MKRRKYTRIVKKKKILSEHVGRYEKKKTFTLWEINDVSLARGTLLGRQNFPPCMSLPSPWLLVTVNCVVVQRIDIIFRKYP